jgi:phosphatidylinositol alpha-1,6-mannosyltransferase
MEKFERALVICPEFGVEEDGSYRPSGLAQFSRCVLRALATSSDIGELTGWGLLDTPIGVEWLRTNYLLGVTKTNVELRGFAGNRRRMTLEFLRANHRYDIVMFLHTGVSRLSVLRPRRRSSLWLVGIDVRRRLKWQERFAVRQANPLLSISTFSNDEMRRYNPGLPSASTVHLCVEPDGPWLGTERSSNPPTFYSAADRAPAAMIVARQAPTQRYKGHDQLILGWSRVLARIPSAELWVVGGGNDQKRLETLAVASGREVARRIRFFGKVSHPKLLELYSQARVFAMPSMGEGFGLVFVEAMRYRMPCICSHDAAAEIVVNEKTGLVVDQTPNAIADACIRLLTDFDLADQMSAAGHLRYQERFTFEAMRARLFRALDLDLEEPIAEPAA